MTASVISGSAADKAGLRVGDVIQTIDAHDVSKLGLSEVHAPLFDPGEHTLCVERGDERLVLSLKLEAPSDPWPACDDAASNAKQDTQAPLLRARQRVRDGNSGETKRVYRRPRPSEPAGVGVKAPEAGTRTPQLTPTTREENVRKLINANLTGKNANHQHEKER